MLTQRSPVRRAQKVHRVLKDSKVPLALTPQSPAQKAHRVLKVLKVHRASKVSKGLRVLLALTALTALEPLPAVRPDRFSRRRRTPTVTRNGSIQPQAEAALTVTDSLAARTTRRPAWSPSRVTTASGSQQETCVALRVQKVLRVPLVLTALLVRKATPAIRVLKDSKVSKALKATPVLMVPMALLALPVLTVPMEPTLSTRMEVPSRPRADARRETSTS